MKKSIDRDKVVGYAAGITTGVTYGLNPLFAMPLMKSGASVESILFFRYSFSVIMLGVWLVLTRESFRISFKQSIRLLILGLLFTTSSLTLFESYKFIPSGLATTIVFLYPVFVAVIMVFMRVYPTWQVWLSIMLTFVGVMILSKSDSTHIIQTKGIVLAMASALAYAMFIVIINRSMAIRKVSNTKLTFYALMVGMVVFFTKSVISGGFDSMLRVFEIRGSVVNLLLLAILPTIVSTATLALSTRKIGATKASVLGVFEPVTAILVGALAFSEEITLNIIIGIILSMAAVVFMIVCGKR
ncbi:MAG: DMT family transporter [Bacteroidales bacterium]|nr:DMT family transporter [Bacteroidales bacterium]MDY5823421.1 DMT family transporter [Candidatus Coprenecus sp.]